MILNRLSPPYLLFINTLRHKEFYMKYLLIITLLAITYSRLPKPDYTTYNTQVRTIAKTLLDQCIPDTRSRKLPTTICYNLHDSFLKDNLR